MSKALGCLAKGSSKALTATGADLAVVNGGVGCTEPSRCAFLSPNQGCRAMLAGAGFLTSSFGELEMLQFVGGEVDKAWSPASLARLTYVPALPNVLQGSLAWVHTKRPTLRPPLARCCERGQALSLQIHRLSRLTLDCLALCRPSWCCGRGRATVPGKPRRHLRIVPPPWHDPP
jgi:hypothetical protein